MKKTNMLVILGLFVFLIGVVQPVYADSWDYNNRPILFYIEFGLTNHAAHLNAAISKFEGTLHAYSVSQNQNVEKQLFTAANDLSSSLNEFNAVLSEVYPDLTEEEQLVIVNVYSSLEVYFVDLVAKANLVFDKNLFWIEYGEPLNNTNESSSPDPDRHIVQFKSGLEH